MISGVIWIGVKNAGVITADKISVLWKINKQSLASNWICTVGNYIFLRYIIYIDKINDEFFKFVDIFRDFMFSLNTLNKKLTYLIFLKKWSTNVTIQWISEMIFQVLQSEKKVCKSKKKEVITYKENRKQ